MESYPHTENHDELIIKQQREIEKEVSTMLMQCAMYNLFVLDQWINASR